MNLILVILFFIPLFASGQINCENCKKTQYPFTGCQNGQKVVICSNTPNNTAGFRPWKKCINQVQFQYDKSTYPLREKTGELYNYRFQPANSSIAYDVFDLNHIQRIITEAFDDWIKPSCYPNFNNDKCQPCPLRVKWARTEEDMLNDADGLAITVQKAQQPVTGGDCQMDCSTAEIRLNGTEDWTGIDPDNVRGTVPNMKNFFKTAFPNVITGKCYDLRSVLRHEIGHWLGFNHPQTGCEKAGAVMNPKNFTPDVIINLDNDAQCMFYILYCCPTNAVSVDEDEIIMDPYIYPHPAHQSVNISLSSSIGKISMIEIRDLLGQTLLVKTIEENMNDTMITLSIGGLSAGKYHIIQLGDKGMVSHPLVKY